MGVRDPYGGNTPALVGAINTYLMVTRATDPDKGVVYIYSSSHANGGDLTIPSGSGTYNWGNVTIVTTGRFETDDDNQQFGYSLYGMNLSLLAGANAQALFDNDIAPCASDPQYAVIKITDNNTKMLGIVCVPYGEFYLVGNTSNGSNNSGAFAGGIVAYSVRLGNSGQNATNWQFEWNPTLYNILYPSTQLMGN